MNLFVALLLSDSLRPCASVQKKWHTYTPSVIAAVDSELAPKSFESCPSAGSGKCKVRGKCSSGKYNADHMHWAAAPTASTDRLRLHVFLHGTDSQPSDYSQWLEASLAAGYHTIGLSYASSPFSEVDASKFCNCSSDSPVDCLSDYHNSVIFGNDTRSQLWHSFGTDSIVARLVALLMRLDRDFPKEGWRSYVWNGEPAWSASAWSGYSQGGGHVAYLLKMKKLNRAMLLSAPQDEFFRATAGTNLSEPLATPWHNVYGLVHAADTHVDTISRNWQRMAHHVARQNLANVHADMSALAGGSMQVSTNQHDANPSSRFFKTSARPHFPCICHSNAYHCSTTRDSCIFSDDDRLTWWQRLLEEDLLEMREPLVVPNDANSEKDDNRSKTLFGFVAVVVSALSLVGMGFIIYGIRRFLFRGWSKTDEEATSLSQSREPHLDTDFTNSPTTLRDAAMQGDAVGNSQI